MTVRDSAVNIVDGDQLNDGYFNDMGGVGPFEAGENITAGNVVYIHLTSGTVFVSDTGAADDIRADGIAINSVTTGGSVYILGKGRTYTTSGLTAKEDYYLGAAGAISTTRSGVRVGTAISTTQLFISIWDDRDAIIGTVKAYHKSLTGIPSNNFTAYWHECSSSAISDSESPLNGQTINLNSTQRFIRGSSTSGTTGGADTHVHRWTTEQGSDVFDTSTGASAITSITSYQSNGSSSQVISGGNDDGYTDVQSSLPAYMEMVWIIKKK